MRLQSLFCLKKWKKLIFSLLIVFIFASCVGKAAVVSAEERPVPVSVSIQERYVAIPESPRPGDPITVATYATIRDVVLLVNGRQAAKADAFLIPAEDYRPNLMAAIITIPSTIEASDAVIRLNGERGIVGEIPIKITQREFRSETLHLTPALTTLTTEPNPQRTAESHRLWQILSTTGTEVYHTGPFLLPVTSTRRTSQFGTRRVSQYPDGSRSGVSIHAGIDFGIPTGTEVFASGRGKVILARHRIISGYSVILEHAPGVYSIYYHLDSIIAVEDEIVEMGEVIGLSGSTGFSTGPHLHWELRVSTENTDPDAFVARPVIDKDLIISRIFKYEY